MWPDRWNSIGRKQEQKPDPTGVMTSTCPSFSLQNPSKKEETHVFSIFVVG